MTNHLKPDFKRYCYFSLCLLFAVFLAACSGSSNEKKILIFSKTAGYHHESIADGVAALQKLGKENGIAVDTTTNAKRFTDQELKQYSAVVFLSTTGDVLNTNEQIAFERYIQAGGGFVGIHAASDTEYEWPWYGKLVGAYFDSHPKVQKAVVNVIDREHETTNFLPEKWERTDEWYNFKPNSINPEVKVLAKLDEKSYEGGKNGDNHPIAWYHEYDGGRAFYTGGGHTTESYKEALFLKHILAGINYAIGDNERDYSQATSQQAPEESRFTVRVLAEKLDEPVELAVAKDGRVFYIERKGKLGLWDPKTKKMTQVGQLDVWTKYEDGLMGIVLDPDFERNNWMYLYYSPNGPVSKNVLSRFDFVGDTLDMRSERVILEVPVQREECCHTGGSMVFDKDGNLFLSLGDNTNPFKSKGYAPLDTRPESKTGDAQGTAGNSNDLRGKIIRIHIEKDGTYTIPDGNLFPKDGKQGRPEIYVMGNRNPYRIALDQQKGWLYWGEIGPDAGKDSIYGPKGHDEINQARKPGFFGWPFFVGDNKPYSPVDFATDKVIGKPFDPKKPVNNSPNNTGLRTLPPAQKAFIWYPYSESPEFPELGKGGRSAMAGPIYYYDHKLASEVKLPEYYDKAVIIYEWMRGWLMAVRLDENGNYKKMERMLSSQAFSHPMDLELGPDGALYMLEYGTNWFAQNDDARLVKIEYTTNNRLPVAKATANVTLGAAPLKVKFSSEGTFDYDDKDSLKYEWRLTSPTEVNSTEKNPTFTFTRPGTYNTILVVTDKEGLSATADIEIRVGNEPPKVAINTTNNRLFYWNNTPLNYTVNVQDKEDGKSTDPNFNRAGLKVYMDYLQQGSDMTVIAQGHQLNTAPAMSAGETLISKSDCKSCHQREKKSIGPAYKDIALRYKGDKGAPDRLAQKIITGGGGNWGDHAMSAHPQLSKETTREMVNFILSLGAEEKPKNMLKAAGNVLFKDHIGKGDEGTYFITASYTDLGGPRIGPLTTKTVLALRSPKIEGESFNDQKKGWRKTFKGNQPFCLGLSKPDAWGKFNNIDLTGVGSINFRTLSEQDGGSLEVHLDNPDGPMIGSIAIKNTGPEVEKFVNLACPIKPTQGFHDIYIVYRTQNFVEGKLPVAIDWMFFDNKGGKR